MVSVWQNARRATWLYNARPSPASLRASLYRSVLASHSAKVLSSVLLFLRILTRPPPDQRHNTENEIAQMSIWDFPVMAITGTKIIGLNRKKKNRRLAVSLC